MMHSSLVLALALLLAFCYCYTPTCPANGLYAENPAPVDDTILVFAVENSLPTDPVHVLNDGLQLGFRNAYGMGNAEIEAYRLEELTYIKKRFGIDYLNAISPIDFSPFSGFAQIPGSVMVPVFYDANGNYRTVVSTNPELQVSANRQPLVQEAEFVITFDSVNPPKLGGTYSPGSNFTAPPGGSIRFGLYKICTAGREFRFKIRSFYPTIRYDEKNPAAVPLVERLMANSPDFGLGWGTFDIRYPSSGPSFNWHVRSYFGFSKNITAKVWPEMFAWDQ